MLATMRSRNYIGKMRIAGAMLQGPTEIYEGATTYFREFARSVPTQATMIWDDLSLLQTWNNTLDADLKTEEIKAAVFDSKGNGSPGPNGIPMRFYQKNWKWVAEDLRKTVIEFQRGGKLTSIDYAWIFLIPKVEGAVDVGDFRPMSLINCSYKIIAKLITNKLGTQSVRWSKLPMQLSSKGDRSWTRWW